MSIHAYTLKIIPFVLQYPPDVAVSCLRLRFKVLHTIRGVLNNIMKTTLIGIPFIVLCPSRGHVI